MRFHQTKLSITTKPFPAAILSSVIASGVLPSAAMAQTEPAQGTITAPDAAVMADKGIDAGPATDIATIDIVIPGPAGDIKARVDSNTGDRNG